MTDSAAFADILAANRRYAAHFTLGELVARAARGLAVVTCIDTRLDPLAMFGLAPGDAKIMRNAGARVTDDVMRSLVLARHLLDVSRIMVIAHTRCAVAAGDDQTLRDAITAAGGPDTSALTFLAMSDQEAALRADVELVRTSPYLSDPVVGGFIYDVQTGLLREVC